MTITYGSILLMKIRAVKLDSDDLTLSLPSSILPGLNADFDGDVLNTLALELPELEEFFRDFSPRAMIFDRATGGIKYTCSALENISLAIMSDMG